MAHHKEVAEFKRLLPVVLPPLPRLSKTKSTTIKEPLPKQVEEVLRQLNGSDVLNNREDYDLLLSQLKKLFTTKKPLAKKHAPCARARLF